MKPVSIFNFECLAFYSVPTSFQDDFTSHRIEDRGLPPPSRSSLRNNHIKIENRSDHVPTTSRQCPSSKTLQSAAIAAAGVVVVGRRAAAGVSFCGGCGRGEGAGVSPFRRRD